MSGGLIFSPGAKESRQKTELCSELRNISLGNLVSLFKKALSWSSTVAIFFTLVIPVKQKMWNICWKADHSGTEAIKYWKKKEFCGPPKIIDWVSEASFLLELVTFRFNKKWSEIFGYFSERVFKKEPKFLHLESWLCDFGHW